MSVAGALRERVDILANAGATSEAGDRSDNWVVVASAIPARMQPKKASELMRAMRGTFEQRFDCTIRTHSAAEVGRRLAWGARTFLIDGVSNLDERGHYLTLNLAELKL